MTLIRLRKGGLKMQMICQRMIRARRERQESSRVCYGTMNLFRRFDRTRSDLALRFMFDEDTVSHTALIGYGETRDTCRPAIGDYGRLCAPQRTSLIHTAALMNGTHTIPRATRTDHASWLTPRLRSISQPSSARRSTSRIA